MKNLTTFVLAGVGLISSGILVAVRTGSANWNNETSQLVTKLKEQSSAGKIKVISFKDLEDMPAPVAKYFRLVLKDKQLPVKTVRLKQEGEFFLNENWIPFEATQDFSTDPVNFVWNADMQMNSLLNVRVRDAFVTGEASMKAKVLSLYPVVDLKGGKELISGSLQRYLAEAVWFPTALWPGENLSWSEIDENRALAILKDSDLEVSLEFRFNEKGEITEVFTPERLREVEGSFIPTPWLGRFSNYQEQNGMLIPFQGEVEWQLKTGNMPYWRGRIKDVSYNFGQ